jgi:ribosomal protein S6--L-glutamate ligase
MTLRTNPPAPPAPGRHGPQPHRIAILSRNARLYSTTRLCEAARAAGHDPIVVDTLACAPVVAHGASAVLEGGRVLEAVDVVVPRIGASVTAHGVAVVAQFELLGTPSVNPAAAIARSRDKLRCLQLLAGAGLDVPRTMLASDGVDVKVAVRALGGLPLIVKLTRGTQGIGVMLAHTLEELSSLLGTMRDLGQEIVLQEFVAESKGRDVRVLVVGGRVVGAMRRTARKGEFRSNLHRGGEGEAIELTEPYARAALAAARAVGLDVAGVDVLEGKGGPRIIEVNSSPGFEGMERATGTDVAGLIVAHAARLAELSHRARGDQSPSATTDREQTSKPRARPRRPVP